MQGLDRRSVLAASAVAAVGLAGTSAHAQDEKQADGDAAPGVDGGEKRVMGTKKWRTATFRNLAGLVRYVNTAPAQGAGEVEIVRIEQNGAIVAIIYI